MIFAPSPVFVFGVALVGENNMQRNRPRMSRFRAIMILLGIIAVLAILGIIVAGIASRNRAPSTVVASRLPCEYNDTLTPFGESVLYYDGASIFCLSEQGAVRWSFRIGSDAGFSCTDKVVVAWAGSTVYILDQNGNSSYNDNLGDTIQFARAGTQYIGAVVGDTTSSRLVVKDHTGAHMDEESDAYENLILLDLGFYGRNGEYMWTLALDVFGTASNTILNTFEVGKMNTGEVDLGEGITYDVVYENSILRVVGTRKMRSFNYSATEDATAAKLVYGWRMIEQEVPQKGSAMLLFAPTTQTENQFDIRELRVLAGDTDKRYSLPDTCVGATVSGKLVYAISGEKLYRAGLKDNRFAEYDLPLNRPVTRYIGTLSDNHAIVACDGEVYVISLPQN